MITCESCRTENLDGAQYCDECGRPLAARSSAAGATAADAQGPPPDATPPDAPPHRPGAWAADSQPPHAASGASGENGSRAPLVFPEASAARAAAHAGPAAAPTEQRAPLPAHALLTINRGHSAGKQFPVHEDEAYIGRWDADSGIFPDVDLDADDPEAKVSRRHARITRRGEQYFIEDLGSTNGTFVNRGRRLLPGDRQPLSDGDEIIIGKTFLKFRVVK
jgi:FHA domain